MSILKLLWHFFWSCVIEVVSDAQKAPTREAPEIPKPTFHETVFLP